MTSAVIAVPRCDWADRAREVTASTVAAGAPAVLEVVGGVGDQRLLPLNTPSTATANRSAGKSESSE